MNKDIKYIRTMRNNWRNLISHSWMEYELDLKGDAIINFQEMTKNDLLYFPILIYSFVLIFRLFTKLIK